MNGDSVLGKLGQLLGHNVFGYCHNSPVRNYDSDGRITEEAQAYYTVRGVTVSSSDYHEFCKAASDYRIIMGEELVIPDIEPLWGIETCQPYITSITYQAETTSPQGFVSDICNALSDLSSLVPIPYLAVALQIASAVAPVFVPANTTEMVLTINISYTGTTKTDKKTPFRCKQRPQTISSEVFVQPLQDNISSHTPGFSSSYNYQTR